MRRRARTDVERPPTSSTSSAARAAVQYAHASVGGALVDAQKTFVSIGSTVDRADGTTFKAAAVVDARTPAHRQTLDVE